MEMTAMQTAAADPARSGMEQRRVLYDLFGRVFDKPLSLADLRGLSMWPASEAVRELQRRGVGADSFECMLATSAGATRETASALRAEFRELFCSPGAVSCAAWGWTLGRCEPLGPTWERALDFYRAHGVSVRSDMVCRADHVGFELSVAALLASRACESHGDGRDARAECEALRDLLDHLLLPWIPDFFKAVAEDGRSWFYGQAARAAGEFLEFDWRCLDDGTNAAWV